MEFGPYEPQWSRPVFFFKVLENVNIFAAYFKKAKK